ncbi:MAG: hypothetical protein AAF366_20155, partial [Pseudomonadota bacterium]
MTEPALPQPDRPLPEVWLFGAFALTGAEMPRHAAEIATGVAAAGWRPRLIGVVPGSFAEAHLDNAGGAMPEGAVAVVYLRALLRAAGRGRQPRHWTHRLPLLLQALRPARRVLIVRDRGGLRGTALLQGALARALQLATRGRARPVPFGRPARSIVAELTGRPTVPVNPIAAEERTFLQILAARPEGQRMAARFVERAQNLAACGTALAEDLARVVETAPGLTSPWLTETLRVLRLSPEVTAPGHIHRCLALAPGSGAPKLVQHLRLCGQGGRARAYLPRPLPRPETPAQRLIQPLLAGVADPDIAARFHRPLGDDPENLTVLELTLLLALRAPMTSIEAFRQPWRRAPWAADLSALLEPGHPAGAGDARPEAPALTLHGLTEGDTGLHQNLWMSVEAAGRAGLSPAIAGHGGKVALATAPARPAPTLRRNVALYHLNADRIPETLFNAYRHRDAFHIGYLLWELDRLPEAHRLALEL